MAECINRVFDVRILATLSKPYNYHLLKSSFYDACNFKFILLFIYFFSFLDRPELMIFHTIEYQSISCILISL